MYLMPNPSNIHSWNGVLFMHRGIWKEAVIKFDIIFASNYPEACPKIYFITKLYHPLIRNDTDMLDLADFADWNPNENNICHVLKIINAGFGTFL
jgi:ubiquitin-protein ligase